MLQGQMQDPAVRAVAGTTGTRSEPAGRRWRPGRFHPMLIGICATLLAGCAMIERVAVNRVADAMSGQGTTFTSDDDPTFVREAIPFGLKLSETILERTPKHRGLHQSLAQGYVAYGFLLQQEADFLEERDRHAARGLRARASKHFLRGRDYAIRGLELRYERFAAKLKSDRTAALASTDRKDATLLYWAGAGWAGAASTAKENLDLVAELSMAAALVKRVLEIDESFDRGAAHAFMISYEGGRPGGSEEAARHHYQRAYELSNGQLAGIHLALAETVAVRKQDAAEFQCLLDKALAVDPAKDESTRLVNTLAQDRARWLRKQIPDLFFESGSATVQCAGVS